MNLSLKRKEDTIASTGIKANRLCDGIDYICFIVVSTVVLNRIIVHQAVDILAQQAAALQLYNIPYKYMELLFAVFSNKIIIK